MQLRQIKKRLMENKNILKITKSLKVMCMSRLRILQKKEKLYQINMAHIRSHVEEKLAKTPYKRDNIIVINILFFTDMSFCGNLNKMNVHIPPLEQRWIVGNKGKKHSGCFIDKLYGKDLCNNIVEKIKITLVMEDMAIVNLFFGDKMIKMEYKIFTDVVDQEYFNCYFYYKLNGYILNFQNEECKIRLVKLTAAINNSEDLSETLNTLYNKTRQQIITSELLELIASGNMEKY